MSVTSYSEALQQSQLGDQVKQARQHHIKHLDELTGELTRLSSLHSSYSSTLSLLHSLPNKLRPSYRVPIGPLAFFPGHLSHPNELLVLLGDNYFLECTAPRARSVCERRMKVVKEKEGKVKEEETRVRERMEAGDAILGGRDKNEQGEEIVEIKEEYHEEEKATPLQPSSRPTRASPPPPAAAPPPAMSDTEFNAYWDKLAELEEEEERREQQQPSSSSSSSSTSFLPSPPPPPVMEEEEEVALPAIRSPADSYKQIKSRREQHAAADTDKEAVKRDQRRVSFDEKPHVAVIDPVSTRPLRHHTHSPPPPAASILPHHSTSTSASTSSLPPSSNPALHSAFTGSVLERAVDSTSTASATTAPPPVKKMSRFMAQRLGLPFDEV